MPNARVVGVWRFRGKFGARFHVGEASFATLPLVKEEESTSLFVCYRHLRQGQILPALPRLLDGGS